MRLAAVKTMNDESESIEPPSSTDAATDPRRPGGIRRWLKGLRNGRNGGSTLRETLEELIEQHEEREAPIDPRERQLIERILTVGAVTVGDAMVPRADIVAVECTTPLDEVVVLMAKETHSRLPVYRDSLDEVIGMVHIKDVLAASLENTGTKKMLPEIARPVLFVAPSMRVLDLLLQMRLARTHMALVVDEYGHFEGIVTSADILEVITGVFQEETGDDPAIVRREDGSYLVAGWMPVDEFGEKLKVAIPRDAKFETVAGYVLSIINRLPSVGETFEHNGWKFEVVDLDGRRIDKVMMTKLD